MALSQAFQAQLAVQSAELLSEKACNRRSRLLGVCMNACNSETSKAGAIKFAKNLYYNARRSSKS